MQIPEFTVHERILVTYSTYSGIFPQCFRKGQ